VKSDVKGVGLCSDSDSDAARCESGSGLCFVDGSLELRLARWEQIKVRSLVECTAPVGGLY
jgi:hypothetical protein